MPWWVKFKVSLNVTDLAILLCLVWVLYMTLKYCAKVLSVYWY
jgi:hypothetical protein